MSKTGPASQSYGLQVAKLAGMPQAVIEEAKHQLQQLEQQSLNQVSLSAQPKPQKELFAPQNTRWLSSYNNCNLMN